MADAKTDREKVIHLTENMRGLLGQPMTFDGFRMPKSGEAGLCFLHQVRVRWEHDDGGHLDPQITFELFENERVSEDQVPAELDNKFLLFCKEGQFHIEKRGNVKCLSDSGHALWPDTFRLTPTLPEACWDDSVKAGSRLVEVVAMRKRENPKKRIEIRWRWMQEVLRSKKPTLVQRNPRGRFGATMYQRHPDGLWIGRPPSSYEYDSKDKGIVKVRSEDNAVTVCLSTEFVRNLELITKEVLLKHMAFLEEAYWGRH